MSNLVIVLKSKVSDQLRREVLIVPTDNSQPTIYSRLTNGGQGRKNLWQKCEPQGVSQAEKMLGTPTAITLTERQVADLEKENLALLTNSTGIASYVEPETTDLFVDVYAAIMAEISTNPALLIRFEKRGMKKNQNRKASKISAWSNPTITQQGTPMETKSADPGTTPGTNLDQDFHQWATLRYPEMTDPEIAGHYEREIQGQKITSVLDFARSNQKAVMITGEAGTGKSSTAEFYAATRDLPICVVECSSGIDITIKEGQYVPTGNGNELRWVYSPLATAIQKPSVILLNEATRMTAKANAMFLRLLAERQLTITSHYGEVIPVHKECLIIADANLDYRGTMKPDQAFLDRHAIKVEFEYDEILERNFIPSDSLLELAKSMRTLASQENKFSTPISTRLLKDFVSVAQGISFRFATYNFSNNFPSDERQSVSMLFATYAQRIADELSVDLGDYEI